MQKRRRKAIEASITAKVTKDNYRLAFLPQTTGEGKMQDHPYHRFITKQGDSGKSRWRMEVFENGNI